MKDKQMKIIRTSMFTGKERTKDLPVTQKQLDDWKGGMVIQEAMPHLSVSDREFIMTGVTDDEWNETFKLDLLDGESYQIRKIKKGENQ